jgi:hypothetical protein
MIEKDDTTKSKTKANPKIRNLKLEKASSLVAKGLHVERTSIIVFNVKLFNQSSAAKPTG